MIMPSGMEDRVVKVENNTRNKDATPFDQGGFKYELQHGLTRRETPRGVS
jgi:hypothetical protein